MHLRQRGGGAFDVVSPIRGAQPGGVRFLPWTVYRGQGPDGVSRNALHSCVTSRCLGDGANDDHARRERPRLAGHEPPCVKEADERP